MEKWRVMLHIGKLDLGEVDIRQGFLEEILYFL